MRQQLAAGELDAGGRPVRFWVLTDERNESEVPNNPILIPHPRDLRSQRAHHPRVLSALYLLLARQTLPSLVLLWSIFPSPPYALRS